MGKRPGRLRARASPSHIRQLDLVVELAVVVSVQHERALEGVATFAILLQHPLRVSQQEFFTALAARHSAQVAVVCDDLAGAGTLSLPSDSLFAILICRDTGAKVEENAGRKECESNLPVIEISHLDPLNDFDLEAVLGLASLQPFQEHLSRARLDLFRLFRRRFLHLCLLGLVPVPQPLGQHHNRDNDADDASDHENDIPNADQNWHQVREMRVVQELLKCSPENPRCVTKGRCRDPWPDGQPPRKRADVCIGVRGIDLAACPELFRCLLQEALDLDYQQVFAQSHFSPPFC